MGLIRLRLFGALLIGAFSAWKSWLALFALASFVQTARSWFEMLKALLRRTILPPIIPFSVRKSGQCRPLDTAGRSHQFPTAARRHLDLLLLRPLILLFSGNSLSF